MTGTLAAMGGPEVVLRGNPEGTLPLIVYRENNLIVIIVPVNAEELRRCGHCRRWLEELDFRQISEERSQRTCRMCLVSHGIISLPIVRC